MGNVRELMKCKKCKEREVEVELNKEAVSKIDIFCYSCKVEMRKENIVKLKEMLNI